MKRSIKLEGDTVAFTYAGEKQIEVKGKEVKFTYEDDTSSPPAVVSPSPPSMHSSIRKLAHDNCLHEIEALGHRADLFLIGQAILLEAYFSADKVKAEALVIGLLGVFIAVAWLLIGLRQNLRINYLSNAVVRGEGDNKNGDEIYVFHNNLEDAVKELSGTFTQVSATPIFALFIPLAILIAWALLIYSNFSELHRYWVILVAIFSIEIFTIMAFYRGKFSEEDCDKLYKERPHKE